MEEIKIYYDRMPSNCKEISYPVVSALFVLTRYSPPVAEIVPKPARYLSIFSFVHACQYKKLA